MPGGGEDDVPYDIKGHITEINAAIIDADFMNTRYDKYIKALHDDSVSPEVKSELRADLHKSFASLSQEDQKYANIILHELDSGDLIPEPGKTMRDYINDCRYRARNEAIQAVVDAFGLNGELLNEMLSLNSQKLISMNLDVLRS